MPPINAILTRSGPTVQHIYLVSLLRLLYRYKCMRTYTVAFAMFPTRSQSAALAATQRIVSNAHKKNYIKALTWADGRRYYALSPKGAKFLNELDPTYCASSTVSSLTKQNKNHRDWGVLIAIASEHRKLPGFSESLIAGDMHHDITTYFGHTPDAITLLNSTAVWHEVEASRRSTTRRAESPNTLSGVEKLAHLIQTLHAKRYITHTGNTYPISLVMHCVGQKIEREVRAVIEKTIIPLAGKTLETGYIVPCTKVNEEMHILINSLPQAPEDGTWSETLPWRGCPGNPQSDVDIFVKRTSK